MALAFSQPVDIVNRAGQHLGQPSITAADFQSATPVTKLAREAQTCYDKLRVSELERNTWTFATRRVILRALTSTTRLWTPAAWAIGTAYVAHDVVSRSGDFYVASAATTGDDPLTAAVWTRYFGAITLDTFDADVSYFAGELVLSSAVIYMSLVNSNSGNTPATSPTDWKVMGGTSAVISILYPIGTGPLSQTVTLNVYHQPYGFLRRAPNQPKVGTPALGAPAYNQADDWVIEGAYIVSGDFGPLLLRYVADITDVTQMDAMFCEGLAACVGEATCEPITQAQDKLAKCEQAYEKAMYRARAVNAIEIGNVDPVEDDYLLVRL